jgi:ABC-type glycerol-3-phosphate transport system substrate-binding protein
MYFGPSWRVFDFEEAKKSQNPTLNYAVMPVPQLPATNITWASYWVEGVAENSKNADAAWDFVKYLSQKDTLQTLYQSESQIRKFGEIYGRRDMADLLQGNPLTSAYISQAPNAKSWYLSSRTGDGPTGINSRISRYFEDAVNRMASGGDATSVLPTVASGVAQVLTDYKIITAAPVPR